MKHAFPQDDRFSGYEPIEVLSFLRVFKETADLNEHTEVAAARLITYLLIVIAKEGYRAHLDEAPPYFSHIRIWFNIFSKPMRLPMSSHCCYTREIIYLVFSLELSHIQFINYSLHIVGLFHISCHNICSAKTALTQSQLIKELLG
jgi:hypothetical protein